MFLLAIHLLAAGVWLGCILVEVAFERALAGHDRRLLADLHRRVDLAIELPALLLVLGTGLPLLARSGGPEGLLALKVAAGLVAIAANLYCVALVLRRAQLARAGDRAGFEAVDHRQHRWGAVVLIGVVAAAALGLARL